MLLYKKLLLMTFGTTYVQSSSKSCTETIPANRVKHIPCIHNNFPTYNPTQRTSVRTPPGTGRTLPVMAISAHLPE